MTDDDRYVLVNAMARQLGEHFDSVQVLVSWNEEGLTKDVYAGGGNWYARVGMARDFLTRDTGETHADRMSSRQSRDEEED